MSKQKNSGIGLFEKYLTLWVVICMVVGVLIGKFLPAVPDFLSQFEYAQVSIPIAILIWLMIYPMMMKVDFASIKNVGKNPKGLFVTWVTNWLIEALYHVRNRLAFLPCAFQSIYPPLIWQRTTWWVVLAALRPTAMVFVWSHSDQW